MLADRVRSRFTAGLIVESVLWALIMASVVHVVWWLLTKGYLPQPFIFFSFDTFMDWHNPGYWAHNPGTYDVWQSVYPPISFVFLRLFSDGACYTSSAIVARDCDLVGRTSILGFWVLSGVVTFLALRRIDRSTALLRATALMLGLPMLYGLERGNLLIPCYVAFVLAHSRILKSARLKWLAHAVAINFKPYLVLTLLPLIVQRRWRWFEGAGIATLVLYLITYAMQGGGSPLDIAVNTQALAALQSSGSWSDIYYATSFSSMVRFINSDFPIAYYTGSKILEQLTFFLPLLMRASQAAVVICFVLSFLHPGAIRARYMTGAICAMILTSSSPSGYAQIFLLFFVFMEPWRGPTRITMLISAYLVSISYDYRIFDVLQPYFDSWLTGRSVQMEVGVAIGQFVRPALLLVIQFGYVTLMILSLVRSVRRKRAREARRVSLLPMSPDLAPSGG
tara:strand:+ start:11021 stop:12373 length:1353 start_codon:yes stop_codon:yes gene_type:complete